MGVRFWHHLFLWFFVAFIIVHVYLAFYHDYIEGRGTDLLDRWRMEVRRGRRVTSGHSDHKTLVLGLGNVIMGDEGIGVHVVRALEKQTLPVNVECLDGGTGGFILLEPLQNASRIILDRCGGGWESARHGDTHDADTFRATIRLR